MFHSCRFISFSTAVVSAFILFASCEVGLGSAVDTEAPEITITYPPSSAVIRDVFVVAGTCSDDKEIGSVSVVVRNTETATDYDAVSAELLNSKKNWKIELGKYNAAESSYVNGWQFPDGKYEITVQATDTSGRLSGKTSRSFEIDNNAPLFIISSPADISSATEYGSTFKIKGSIAEDHTVKTLAVHVYGSDKTTDKGTYTASNIDPSMMSTDGITLARYKINAASDDEQNKNYLAIYGSNSSGTIPFFCSITVTDNAKIWEEPDYTGSASIETNTTTGNTTDKLYLNSAVYSKLMGKNSAYQLDTTSIKKIMNGTYTGSVDTNAVKQILTSALVDSSDSEGQLAFSLNKDSSPTYSIVGYTVTTSASSVDFGTNKASKLGKVTFKAAAGRDGTYFKPSTISVYLFGPFESLTENDISARVAAPETYYENYKDGNTAGNAVQAYKLAFDKTPETAPAELYTGSVTLPGVIKTGKLYVFAATGYDEDDLELEGDGYYGFTGESTGAAPTVSLAEPEDGAYEKSGTSVVFTGSAASEEAKIASVAYTVTVFDEADSNKKVGTITGSATADDGAFDSTSESWAFDVKNGTEICNTGYTTCRPAEKSGKRYLYSVKITAKDENGVTKDYTSTVHIDSDVPVITLENPSPLVTVSSVNYVNGTIAVTGKITDKNRSTAELTVSDGTTTNKYPFDVSLSESVTEDIDTTLYADNATLTLTLTGIDAAGNSGTETALYTISQQTDKPEMETTSASTAVTKNQIAVNNNLFGVTSNNKFSGTVTDDDGIESVVITAYDKNEKQIGTTGAVSLADAGLSANPVTISLTSGAKTVTVPYTMPSTEGNYTIKITAVDSTYNNTAAAGIKACRTAEWTYAVAVDAASPTLAFNTTNKMRTAASKAKTVTGTAWDTSGLKSLKRYATTENTDVAKISGSAEAWWTNDETANGTNTITFADTTWTDTLSDTVIGTVNSRRRYVATDIYGNETILDFIYYVDAARPTYEIITPAAPATPTVINGKNSYTVSGKAADDNVDISSVQFCICASGKTPKTVSDTVGTGTADIYDTSVEKNSDGTAHSAWEKATVGDSLDENKKTSWKATVDLSDTAYADGTYLVYFVVTDSAGNKSVPASGCIVNLTSDKTSPAVTINSTASTYTALPVLSGTITENNLDSLTVTYTVKTADATETQTTTVTPSGTAWSFALLKAGNYTSIVFKAVDKAGFSDEKSVSTIVDTADPLVYAASSSGWKNSSTQTIISWAGDTGTSGSVYSSGLASVQYFKTYNGTTDSAGTDMAQGAKCDVNGTTTGGLYYNKYTSTLTMNDGTTTVAVTATDAAGRSGLVTGKTFLVDTTAPNITNVTTNVTGNKMNIANHSGAILTVASSDINSSLTGHTGDVSGLKEIVLKKGGKTLSTTAISAVTGTNTATTAVSVPDGNIVEGDNVFTVTVTDIAGNTSAETSVTFTADLSVPAVELTSHVQNATVNKTISVSGTATDNIALDGNAPVLNVYDNTNSKWVAVSGCTSSYSSGTWTITGFNTVTYTAAQYDTDTSSDGIQLKLNAVFTDSYGNKNSTAIRTLTADQNSDRPIVKLTNIKRSGTAINQSKTVYGTITDDDGTVKGLWVTSDATLAANAVSTPATYAPSTGDAKNWEKVTIADDGSWSHDAANEGATSWYFYCTDYAGTSFTTKSTDALLRLYVNGKDDTSNVDNSTAVSFTADMNPPSVQMYVSHDSTTTAAAWAQYSTPFGGTTGKYAYVKLVVTEAVAMDGTTPVTFNNMTNQPALQTSSSASGVYTYYYGPVDTSSCSEGNNTISITALDASGQKGNGSVNITVDNTAPTVGIVSPTTNISDAVTGKITIKGISSDTYAGVSSLKYYIPSAAEVTNNTVPATDTDSWKALSTGSTWEISFTSGATDTTDSLLYYANSTYASETYSGSNIWKIPVYFYAADAVGNSKTVTDLYVLGDSDSGKPKSWIIYPETGLTTSDTVTVYGGASDNEFVSSVQMQLDVNGDGDFTTDDYDVINAWALGTDVKDNLKAGDGSDSGWYISVSGTNSWKRAVDTTKLASTVTTLGIRVRAYDNEGQTRPWTNGLSVAINNEVPVIQNLKLVQYASGNSGTVKKSREYIPGMYISGASGTWYLTGTCKSANSKVDSVKLVKQTSTSVTYLDLSASVTGIGASSYALNIEVPASTSGQIYSVLTVTDNNATPHSVSQDIKFSIDSTAPSLYTTANKETATATEILRIKALGANLTDNSVSSPNTVQNNNYYFTFGDKVLEGGSGLYALAFYFERKPVSGSTVTDSNTRIYCPMTSAGYQIIETSTPASPSAGEVYINSDSLPVVYVSGTRSAEDSFTAGTALNAYQVRSGNLIKIAGQYCRIASVSGNTVTFSPGVDTSFTTAEIVYAQVVDHSLQESYSDDYTTVNNDDGDGMMETLYAESSTYSWTAGIDSTNIPDGPAELHVVVIDNAGNMNSGYASTFVTNKSPRITKVLIGTDLDGDGYFNYYGTKAPVTSVDAEKRTATGLAFGEFSYYPAINLTTGKAQQTVTLDSSAFKIKNRLCVLPEFTGGNTSLGYIYSIDSSDSTTNVTGSVTALSTSVASAGLAVKNKTGSSASYADELDAMGGFVLENTALTDSSGAVKYIKCTFWDKTQETTQGTNSQWSLLKIPAIIDTTDSIAPAPTITPFYYTSETDNSAYTVTSGSTTTTYGHVELENSSSAVTTNPAVSGIIRIKGTAYDDTRLASISLVMSGININGQGTGNTATLATYSKGSWTVTAGDAVNSGWAFSITSDEITQSGHTAEWELDVDTKTLSTGAGTSIIYVKSSDATGNPSVLGTAQTTTAEKTSRYTVSVVPYITSVTTELSEFYRSAPSVYARTAKGHYPVRENESITIKGYNLWANGYAPAITLNETTLSATSSSSTALVTSVGTSAKSGALVVTVNGTACLNNSNSTTAAYDLQPNSVNNNTLTDDVNLDVWQFKNAANPVNGSAKQVTMKISPTTGIPGFSFANSILYFNMPAYASDQPADNWGANTAVTGSVYSQIPVGMNYGGFSYNTFCYDSYGYPYGAAMCTDTQSAYASAYFQFFSREQPIPSGSMDQNMNYCNTPNASRLDSSSVQVGSNDTTGWVTNIDRIQSPAMEATYSGSSSTAPSSGTPTYVYIAYYDDAVKQIRFRWGTVGGYTDNIDGKANSTKDSNASGYGLDDVVGSQYTGFAQGARTDGSLRPSKVTDSYRKYGSDKIQVVAASGVSGAMSYYSSATTHCAGKYVALSIVNKNTSSPVAIVTWYDSVNQQLCMAYNTSPTTSGWTTRVIDSAGGINVKTAVDGDNGIHFAYYNTSGSDLKYAYLSSYNTSDSPQIVTVDSFLSVGAKCTIDVAKNSDGNWVPYIGYQMNANLGTPAAAKVACRSDFSTTAVPAGVDSEDRYTGYWECSIVPTANIPNDDQINVGVYRNSSGYAQAFTSNISWTASDTNPSGYVSNSTSNVNPATIVHGNNTANPIIGYGIDTGAVEMGQKK